MSGNSLSPEEFLSCLDFFQEYGYHELTMVMITTNMEHYPLWDFMEDLALDKIIEEWGSGIGDRFLKYITDSARKALSQ